MRYRKELEYVGNVSQLIHVQELRLTGGKADGVRMLNVRNGAGLSFEVAADRGMDIPYLNYKGLNVGFLTFPGVTAPTYFREEGNGFLHSFAAGFLTTWGLWNIGNPGEYQGRAYGLHGQISHTPAEEFGYRVEEGEEDPFVHIQGKMKEREIFKEKLSMERSIRCRYRERKIYLRDVVKNQGYKPEQHMLLYHFNLGYPLLDEEAVLYIPSEEILPRTQGAREDMENWRRISAPEEGYEEKCYYHRLHRDDKGLCQVGLFQPKLGFGVGIRFEGNALTHFVQWKMMGKGDYVMGLEPCNCTIDGVKDAFEKGMVRLLKPGEKVVYRTEIMILDGWKEFDEFMKGVPNEEVVSG